MGAVPVGDVNTTLALPGYYCKNKGHQPSYVPFTNVNDGVCDYQLCCDGSDEWAKVGGIKCDDRCKEIGKEWRKLDEQRKKSASNAAKRRKELVAQSAILRQEVEAKIHTLETEIQGEEIKLKGLEANLAEAERQERGKVVKRPGSGGKLSMLIQLAKDRIEELREALIEVRSQRDMGKARIAELEGILTTFKEEYNPNFNDEGVKRAVRSWEDYAARDKPTIGDEAHDRDLDEIAKPDSETGAIKWNEWEEPEESDVDVRKCCPHGSFLQGTQIDALQSIGLKPTFPPHFETGSTRNYATYASCSSRMVSSLRVATFRHPKKLRTRAMPSKLLRTVSRTIGIRSIHIRKILRRTMAQMTFSAPSKINASPKTLGNTPMSFAGWEPLSRYQRKITGGLQWAILCQLIALQLMMNYLRMGKDSGLASGSHSGMRMGNIVGMVPNRSTLVVLACAETDELWKITEEEKCVYRMEVGTPAVCEVAEKAQAPKDEL